METLSQRLMPTDEARQLVDEKKHDLYRTSLAWDNFTTSLKRYELSNCLTTTDDETVLVIERESKTGDKVITVMPAQKRTTIWMDVEPHSFSVTVLTNGYISVPEGLDPGDEDIEAIGEALDKHPDVVRNHLLD
jgi:hypothetical protein